MEVETDSETHIANNIRSLPPEYWSVEICQLTSQFSEVISHAETVGYCADSVLPILEVAGELRGIVGVGDDSCVIRIVSSVRKLYIP